LTATLHENIVMGESASEDGLGFQATRKVVVSNLLYGTVNRPGGIFVTKDNLLNAAIDFINWLDIWNGYPVNFKLGGSHSGIPNCYLETRSPKALSKDVVEIDLQYRGFNATQPAKISFRGGIESKETNRGWYFNGSSFESTKTDMYVMHGTDKTGMSASVGVPTIQIVAEQNEVREFLAMKQRIQIYQGTLNGSTFLNDAPGTWLCQEIEAPRIYSYSGSSWGYYAVRYVLAKVCTPLGWDFEGLYLVPETGRPPDTVVYGSERRRYQVLDTMDWSGIGIRGITV
jgi:hypothetical protein